MSPRSRSERRAHERPRPPGRKGHLRQDRLVELYELRAGRSQLLELRAEELDDVVDDLLEVSHRMQVTGITTALPELKEQADYVATGEEVEGVLEILSRLA